MDRIWSDREIESLAADVAHQIARVASSARNEAELRIAVNPILKDAVAHIGVDLEDRHEKLVGRGRADSVYGSVVIEYEDPGSLSDRPGAARNKHAIQQVKVYAEGLSRQESREAARFLGVVLDGTRIIFVRRRRDDWDVSAVRRVDAQSVADLLVRLKSLRGKALLPENLLADFGGQEVRGGFTASDTAARCVGAFYQALTSSDDPKAEALFAQWRLLFSEVCGYAFASPKLDLEGLAGSYGVTLARPTRRKGKQAADAGPAARQTEALFFCIHTYYATLLTLLAAEIVTYYMSSYMPSYLGQLEGYDPVRLRRELRSLHTTGGVFGQLGVQNFLEGDFFAWYVECWDDRVGAALQSLVRTLRTYDAATFQVEPEETRDLLKKLYQYLLPKKLRHDLGEYYTPDWLAELVLNEIGYDGSPEKRILDPACGSGTFLVMEIRRAKAWAQERLHGNRETLESILGGIVGFDLNPVAVITARTNYLIALGDLLRHRSGSVEIPIYLCDSVLTPSERRQLTLGSRHFPLETAVGTLEVPLALGTQERVGALSHLLEESVRLQYTPVAFMGRARAELGLSPDEFADASECLERLYGKLQGLEREGRNGVWARVIRNFFAPVFEVSEREFDFVAGNPPWVNWESLPDRYRQNTARLWEDYGLFSLKGWRARMGGSKKDLSALFLYVAADRYLRDGGRLGFVITESLLKTSGAGEGFRRLELPARPRQRPLGLRIERVHDLVQVQPFEGAANRTAVISVLKGAATEPPVEYVLWTRPRGVRLADDHDLAAVQAMTVRSEHVAYPVSPKRGSPWITGPAVALSGAQKAIGRSHYRASAGACTWLNGAYWFRVLERLPQGALLVENLGDVGKIPVPTVRVRIESDLLYPLLRGRDIRPWRAQTSDHILMVQDPATRKGHSEHDMRTRWPLTYAYLKTLEQELRGRSGFRKYFQPGDPFYSMYDVGPQALSPTKVVWRQMVPDLTPAVISEVDGKPAVPQHVVTFVPFASTNEAHYFCALMGSSISRFISASYSTGKSFGAPHVLDHIGIPRYAATDPVHKRLSSLSRRAHRAAAERDPSLLVQTAEGIDDSASEVWGIGAAELRAIQAAVPNRAYSEPVVSDDDLGDYE
jgi:hypothetical protein